MAHDPESPRPPGSATVTRRTLAKGAAWTTPVLMVGIVAPAEAASPNCPPNCFGAGTPSPATWSAGGALVGSWAYIVNLGVTNTGGTCPNISAFRIAVGSNVTITRITYANGYSEADTRIHQSGRFGEHRDVDDDPCLRRTKPVPQHRGYLGRRRHPGLRHPQPHREPGRRCRRHLPGVRLLELDGHDPTTQQLRVGVRCKWNRRPGPVTPSLGVAAGREPLPASVAM